MDIPGLEILDRLGESSMTEVWKAYQRSLQRAVTVKILKTEFANHADEVERFCAEAKQTACLKHKRIVQIYDVVVHDGRHLLLMEYVPGPTIEEVLRSKRAIASRAAMRIACGVAEALHYAWNDHRMIHRNVTPRAVFLDASREPRLAYTGLSLRVDPLRPDDKFRPGVVEGTPYYMSPEQASASPDLDCRTDMYSLGATLYQMITGAVPFGKFSPRDALRCQVGEKLRHPSEFASRLPDGAAYVIEKLMMKNPADRFPDWDAALKALRQAAKGKLIVMRKKRNQQSTIASRRRASRRATSS